MGFENLRDMLLTILFVKKLLKSTSVGIFGNNPVEIHLIYSNQHEPHVLMIKGNVGSHISIC